MGMKRVNTKGIAGAEKHVLMASMCYNLQKLLKFKKLNPDAKTITMQTKIESFTDIFFSMFFACFRSFAAEISQCFSGLKIATQNLSSLKQADLSSDFNCFGGKYYTARKMVVVQQARAIWRNGGSSPAETTVQICNFVPRRKCSGSRHYAKPLGR